MTSGPPDNGQRALLCLLEFPCNMRKVTYSQAASPLPITCQRQQSVEEYPPRLFIPVRVLAAGRLPRMRPVRGPVHR